jgi:hypothetical protein
MNKILQAHQAREGAAAEGQPPVMLADPTKLVDKALGGPPATPAPKPEPKRLLIGDSGKLGQLSTVKNPNYDQHPSRFEEMAVGRATLNEFVKCPPIDDETLAYLKKTQSKCEELIVLMHYHAPGEVARRHMDHIHEDTVGVKGIESYDMSLAERQRLGREKKMSAGMELHDLQKQFAPVCRAILHNIVLAYEDLLEEIDEQDAARAAEFGIEHVCRSEVYVAVRATVKVARAQAEGRWEDVSGSEFMPSSMLRGFVEF